MPFGTVAALSRGKAMLAIRCADGQYTLIRFPESWKPSVGERVEGDLTRLGLRNFTLINGTVHRVEVQSFNCTAEFARARLLT